MTTGEQLDRSDDFEALLAQERAQALKTLKDLQELYEGYHKVEKKDHPFEAHRYAVRKFAGHIKQWANARSQFIAADMLQHIWSKGETILDREDSVRPVLMAGEQVRMLHRPLQQFENDMDAAEPAGIFYQHSLAEFNRLCPLYNPMTKQINKNDRASLPNRRDVIQMAFAGAGAGLITGQAFKAVMQPTTTAEARREALTGYGIGVPLGITAYLATNRPTLPTSHREFEQLANNLSVVYQQIEKRQLDAQQQAAQALQARVAEYMSDLPYYFSQMEASFTPQEKALWDEFHTHMCAALKAAPAVSEEEPIGHYARIHRAYEQQNEQIQALYPQFEPLLQLVAAHSEQHATPGKLNAASSSTCLNIIGKLQTCTGELMDKNEDIMARSDTMALYAHQPGVRVMR